MPTPSPAARGSRNAPPVRMLSSSLAIALVSGCTSLQDNDNVLGIITPYRMEVVQGNVVTKEQIEVLRPGVSRQQVRDVLGSPLLTDIFHADRWDYVFTIRRQGTDPQRRAVVAHFEGDLLKRLDAPDDLPSEREFVASLRRSSARGTTPTLELTPEERAALPKPQPVAAAASAAVLGPAREYPPLEKP